MFSRKVKPATSTILTCYLKQCNEPPWTSYFVKYKDVKNDQRGLSHFNWKVGQSNYHILRTGCFPYIKYHCSKYRYEDLSASNRFMYFIKLFNFGTFGKIVLELSCFKFHQILNFDCSSGIPSLMYGIAAIFLITHRELVETPNGDVYIYFLLKENKQSIY